MAVAPGSTSTPTVGNRFIRFSFAGKRDDVETGLARLAGFLAG